MLTNPVETLINVELFPSQLSFMTGGKRVTFAVMVTNFSDRFASFQVILEAAGSDPEDTIEWYKLEPDVSSKTPPGGTAQFQVTIIKNPVPGFVGQMDILVRLLSIELPESENRQLLRLNLEPGTEAIALQLELPTKDFQSYPEQKIVIPVQIEQLGDRPTPVNIQIRGLPISWLESEIRQRIALAPKKKVEIHFTCQIPAKQEAISQIYPFTIEADHGAGKATEITGTLHILPVGKINLNCHPLSQQIPATKPWLPRRRLAPAIYELQLDNQSNLVQRVGATLAQSEEFPKTWEIANKNESKFPLLLLEVFLLLFEEDQLTATLFLWEYQTITINPGATETLELKVKGQRPWFWQVKNLFFSVTPRSLEEKLETSREQQTLELKIYPKIPLWLGGLTAILILWLGYWFSCLNPYSLICGHQKSVKSVQFNGRGLNGISGSDDQTIREWNLDEFNWTHLFFNPVIKPIIKTGNNSSFKTDAKAVRIVRYTPVENNLVAAGLENGEIQLWNLLGERKYPQALLKGNLANRVLDLDFTLDSKFLYSSYGNGEVLQWEIGFLSSSKENSDPTKIEANKAQIFPFAIYSLTLVGENEEFLALAGQYNTLCLTEGNLAVNKCEPVGKPDGNDQAYIQSITKAEGKPYLLATANNQGKISLWNLSENNCWQNPQQCKDINPLETWQENINESYPVYSVALSDNGCYLVSGGERGKVLLWLLNPDGRRATPDPILITHSSKPINTVDVKVIGHNIYILNGGDQTQVKLNAYKRKRLRKYGCDV